MYKKILVPLDGSQLAEAVLPHAQALAKSEGAELILLRVPLTPDEHLFSRNPVEGSNIVKIMEEEAQEYLYLEVSKLREEGTAATGITREGAVPETILSVAEETHADVIAMSTHGRSGVQRWLMGSVADRVVHYAHIPVMLIHPSPN